MKKYLSPGAALLFILSISFSACKEQDEEDFDTQSSQDNAYAESIFNEINEIADQAVNDGVLSTHRMSNAEGSLLTSCAAITFDTSNGSGSVTVNFGDHFCQGADSKYRKGTIIVVFDGPYKSQGTVITISAINYFTGYDSVYTGKINGTRTVTNTGLNTSGHLSYTVEVHANLINYLNEVMTWNSHRVREWIAGDSTSDWLDDEYLITGSASGKSFAGLNFSADIMQALHIKLSCHYITEGKFTLTPENKASRYFDFGTGGCDNDATVTIGDKTYQITLR